MSRASNESKKKVNPEEKGIRVAGALRRSFATAVDLIGFTILAYLIWVGPVDPSSLLPELHLWFGDAESLIEALLPFFHCLALGIGFSAVCELILLSTPGKWLVGGMRVLTRGGEQPSRIRAGLRVLFKWLSLILLGIPHAWVFVDGERRTLYDRMTGLLVGRLVRVPSTGKSPT